MIKYFLAPLLLLMFIIYASEAKANPDTHNHDINKPNISNNDVFALNEAPDDHVLGSNKAPITIIVWASVTCPHCSDWFSNEWPVFNKMLEFQMLNQKEMFEMASKGEALSFYKKIGKMSGLKDDNDINVCMQTKEKFDHIINNGKRAQNAGVSGVPSFYINGRNYNSELDAISFVKLVEKMIERGLSDFTELN